MYGVIYKITNTKNNKVYIGQTVRSFRDRYNNNLEKYTHNEHLQRSIEKYGIEAFEIDEEFAVADTLEELNKLETKHIIEFKSYDPKFGYNKDFGGNSKEKTDETKEKMKLAQEQYKTAIVMLDKEFNLIDRFAGAVDVVGFDRVSITNACIRKVTIKGYYFLYQDEYEIALADAKELLKLKSEVAAKYSNYIALDKSGEVILNSLELAGAYSISKVKKYLNKCLLDRELIFVKLDDYLNKSINLDYGKTVVAIKDGKIAMQFLNVTDCLSKGFEKARVSACISGKRISYMGYEWYYKNNFTKKL